MRTRKTFEAGFKARVALEALKGEKTVAQISAEYQVHATQVNQWRQELVERSKEIFAKPDTRPLQEQQEQIDRMHKAIGEITMENNWYKKKLQQLG